MLEESTRSDKRAVCYRALGADGGVAGWLEMTSAKCQVLRAMTEPGSHSVLDTVLSEEEEG